MDDCIAGADIAQHYSDIVVSGRSAQRFAHNARGFNALHDWLRQHHVTAVAMEASGGYERPLCRVLAGHDIAIMRINPARIRAFAHATGCLSKTDPLDAALIQHYAQTLRPAVQRWCEQEQQLRDWVARRDQMVEMRKTEKQRARHPATTTAVRQDIQHVIAWLDGRITALEDQIDQCIEAIPAMQHYHHIMTSIPGIGTTTATALLAYCPEIGTLSSSQIAALAGLAPHAKQSGTSVRSSSIKGGRPALRRTMYLAALSATRYHPTLKHFAKRLQKQGKKPKQILIAVARKLIVIANALVKNNTTWIPDYA